MTHVSQVTIVLAHYCPHCVPFSLTNAQRVSRDLGVPLRVLDIEVSKQESEADTLVQTYGDWSEDYLIPQVFVEYNNGHVQHVLTGFSESVAVTEAAWDTFFRSSYYRNLIRESMTGKKPVPDIVAQYLRFQGRCRRHCDAPTSLRVLKSRETNVVGAYVCPRGYVSRVVYVSRHPDVDWFHDFLTRQVGAGIVKDRDLRPATRYGWELQGAHGTDHTETNPRGFIKEIYWTMYPRTEEERRQGLFLCSDPQTKRGCEHLFMQNLTSRNRLCPKCR